MSQERRLSSNADQRSEAGLPSGRDRRRDSRNRVVVCHRAGRRRRRRRDGPSIARYEIRA